MPSTEPAAPQTANVPTPTPSNPSIVNTTVASAITSVTWAPSCGRSCHLVATGGRDGHVRIWKIKPGLDDVDDEVMMGGVESEDKWTAVLVADFDQHK